MTTLTRKEAIRAKCKDCCYDPLDEGTWVAQVESCTATDCSLHEYRPLTQATISARKTARLLDASPEELRLHRERQESAMRQFHAGRNG